MHERTTGERGSGSPVSAEDLRALQAAKKRAKTIRRCAAIASMSGWSMVVFAVLTVALGLTGDWIAVTVGVALGAIAWNELRGGWAVRRFEARGARILGWNQVFLGVLIVSYGGLGLMHAMKLSGLSALQGQTTGDPSVDELMVSMAKGLTVVVYSAVAGFGVIVPGLTSVYYFSRGAVIREFVEATPEWVVATLTAAG